MSISVTSFAAKPNAVSLYAKNVGAAARALAEALLAIEPARHNAASDKAGAACGKPRSEGLSLYRLYRMASACDSVSPALANELRVIASRG